MANTQVDAIHYCTGGGGLFWAHQPKVGEILGEWVEESHAPYVKGMRDGLIALKEQGTDPLAVVVDYAHNNRMEVFWSYRMNNCECSFVSWGLSRRKREHPEYLMGDESLWDHAKQTDPRTWWTLWDYEKPGVRDHIVRIFEDVCQRYDVDGIELDFIRHPLFFRPNLDGLPAEPKHVAMMTDMVRRIRAGHRARIDETRPPHIGIGPRSSEREELPGYRTGYPSLSARGPDGYPDRRAGLRPDGSSLFIEGHG